MPLREERDEDLRLGKSLDANGDREVTLSTGTVLGVFMALALSWAVFFGFGYSMGRKSMQPSPTATAAEPAETSDQFGKFKPAPGNAGAATPPKASAPITTPITTTTTTVASTEATPAPAAPQRPSAATVAVAAPPVRVTPPAPPATAPVAAANGATPVVVQIAAVSHKEDADVLTSALERRGYKVSAHTDTNDHFIHVQIGPFASRKDAEAMRARLLADGYNAILK